MTCNLAGDVTPAGLVLPFRSRNRLDLTVNKAFVKEQEDETGRCPRCGAAGVVVHEKTLRGQIPAALVAEISFVANFCASGNCVVAYFDSFGRTILVSQLNAAIYPKDPAAAICPCNGFYESDILNDVEHGQAVHTRAAIEQAGRVGSDCEARSPDGRNCSERIQKCFMRLWQQSRGS